MDYSALRVGDQVAWIERSYARRAYLGTVVRRTPTMLLVESDSFRDETRWYRDTGAKVGDRWLKLIAPDDPDVIRHLIDQAYTDMASEIASYTLKVSRTKANERPGALKAIEHVADVVEEARARAAELSAQLPRKVSS